MKYPKIGLAVFCSSLITGCASFEAIVAPMQDHKEILNSRDISVQQLNNIDVCCVDFRAFKFNQLMSGQKEMVVIDSHATTFVFPEGKSYFSAFKLPVNSGDLKITVAGLMDKTLFNPTVMLLDANFNITRTIGSDIIIYKPARMLDGDRVEGVFTIDRTYVGNLNNETYLIIYTDHHTLSQSTEAMSPSKIMAKSLSVQNYGAKDPLIPHSAWGLVSIDIEDMSTSKLGSNFYKPIYQDTIDANTPIIDLAPNKLLIGDKPVLATSISASIPTILPETDSFYQRQIEQAVSRGELDKALQLVNEAERAGSTSAKTIFIDAIKRTPMR